MVTDHRDLNELSLNMLSQQLNINANADSLVERIEAKLRAGALSKAAQAAGELVENDARPRITAPGYKGDKAGLKPLQDSLDTVVREYRTAVVAIVGTKFPEGAHGHLVEFGHELVKNGIVIGHVPPHPFLRPAIETTTEAQQQVVFATLKEAAPKS